MLREDSSVRAAREKGVRCAGGMVAGVRVRGASVARVRVACKRGVGARYAKPCSVRGDAVVW